MKKLILILCLICSVAYGEDYTPKSFSVEQTPVEVYKLKIRVHILEVRIERLEQEPCPLQTMLEDNDLYIEAKEVEKKLEKEEEEKDEEIKNPHPDVIYFKPEHCPNYGLCPIDK